MGADIRCVLLSICAVLMTVLSVRAEDRSFAALLIEARAQAAAGHRWTPPGDNMTETIMRMIDLIPTATPTQLSELSALIESGRTGPLSTALKSDLMTEGPPLPAVPAPPPVLPSRPGPDQAGQVALGQVPSSPTTPVSITPLPITTNPVTAGPITPLPITINPVTTNPVTTNPVTTNPITTNPITTSPVTAGPVAPGHGKPEAGSRAAVLFARGLDAELHGDFSGARRFYSSAAQEDDAAAARHLGRLYDPDYLKRTALGGVDSDPTLARHWYERAISLGDAEAVPLLEALSVR
jgi:hypothetical protein